MTCKTKVYFLNKLSILLKYTKLLISIHNKQIISTFINSLNLNLFITYNFKSKKIC